MVIKSVAFQNCKIQKYYQIITKIYFRIRDLSTCFGFLRYSFSFNVLEVWFNFDKLFTDCGFWGSFFTGRHQESTDLALALPRVVYSGDSIDFGTLQEASLERSRGLYLHVLLIVLFPHFFWGFVIFILFVLAWQKYQISFLFFILYVHRKHGSCFDRRKQLQSQLKIKIQVLGSI